MQLVLVVLKIIKVSSHVETFCDRLCDLNFYEKFRHSEMKINKLK